MQFVVAFSHVNNVLPVQGIARHNAVDRFLHAQAVRVVHKFRRHARPLHLLQLPAVLPSVCPRPVAQRIANRIVANRVSVDRRELVAPVRVTVGIGNSFQRIRRVGIRKAFLFQDIAAKVVSVLPSRTIFARAGVAVVVDLNQLPQRVVAVPRPLAVQRCTRNVPVVVVAVAAIAPRLGNRRNEVRHTAGAVAARREMVFARERLAAQLDRRERRSIQLVNGRRTLPDGGRTNAVRQRRRTIFVIIAEFRPIFLSIFTHFLRKFAQVAVHVVIRDLSRVDVLRVLRRLYAHWTIRQIVLALRRPIQQIVANSCHLTLRVVVILVSRRSFLAVHHPRHAIEVIVPTADFRPVAVSRRGQRAEIRLRRIVLIRTLRQGLIPDLDRRLATQRVLLESIHHVVRGVPVRIVTDFDQIPTLCVIGIFVMYCLNSFFCAHVCRGFYNSPQIVVFIRHRLPLRIGDARRRAALRVGLHAHNLAARVLLLRNIVAVIRVRSLAADEVARIRVRILHLTRQRIPERIVSEDADTAQRRNAFQQQMLLLLRFRLAVMEDAGYRAARGGVLRQVVRIVKFGFLLAAVEHLPRLAVAIFVINILRTKRFRVQVDARKVCKVHLPIHLQDHTDIGAVIGRNNARARELPVAFFRIEDRRTARCPVALVRHRVSGSKLNGNSAVAVVVQIVLLRERAAPAAHRESVADFAVVPELLVVCYRAIVAACQTNFLRIVMFQAVRCVKFILRRLQRQHFNIRSIVFANRPCLRLAVRTGHREVTVLNHIEMIQRQPFFQLHRIEPAIAAREAVLHVAVRHAVNLRFCILRQREGHRHTFIRHVVCLFPHLARLRIQRNFLSAHRVRNAHHTARAARSDISRQRVRLARRERHRLTDIHAVARPNRQPIRNETELPRGLVARNRTRAALFPNAAVFLAHRVEKQISNHSLHPGALRCMVNRRIRVVVGAVVAGVHCIAQLVVHADLIAVIVEVIAQRLAGNFILDHRHMIAVGVRDIRRSQRRAILRARHGRVGDAVRQTVDGVRVAVFVSHVRKLLIFLILDVRFNSRCRHKQVITVCKRVFVLAHASIFMRNVQSFFIIIVEAHAAVFILPRCLNPVAATIRVMERRNSVRAVRHRCDFQRRIRQRRHRDFVANRILNLLNQCLPSFRRILRRRLAHQRERHSIVALIGNRDVLIPDFQRQRQTRLVRILLLVILILLEEVFRAVAVRVHELHFAIIQHLVQRLMQRSPPAVAHAELVLVAVARIVIVRNRDRQTIAVHRRVRVSENQVAVDEADAASPCQARRLMVVSQIAFQTRKACIFQHKVRLIRRFARMKLRKAAFTFGRAQLNAVIFAQIPLARKTRDVELFPRILIFQYAAIVLIHAADIRLVVIGDCLRIPALQHFLAHDGGVRRRCVDVANAQLRGRDEVVRAQTRQVHDLQVGQAVAVVIRVADPQTLVMRKVLRRTFLDVGIEDARGVFRAICAVRERRNRAVRLRRHLLALFGGKFHPLVRRRVVLVHRRGLHHRPETVVAQRVHLAAAGAEVFQFLLIWELNLFLIGFLVTHMFPFFSVRSFRARFFYRRVRKKPIAPCAGASLYLSMV